MTETHIRSEGGEAQPAALRREATALGWARSSKLTAQARVDEAAAALQLVALPKMVICGLAGLLALLLLPWSVCAAWVAGGLVVEAWGWFASRPRNPVRRDWRPRAVNFISSYVVSNLWWLLLGVLFWNVGGVTGHAAGAVTFAAVISVCVLLFHNAPVTYLAAGSAPAAAVIAVLGVTEARDWREMVPIWLMLGLSAVFSLGRALDTPSAQHAQRRLNDSLYNYEILTENVTDIIARTDLNGVREYVSPACLAVLGYRPDELIGQPRWAIHHPDNDTDAIARAMQRLLADPSQSACLTFRVRHKDGRWVWMQSNARLVCEGGVPVGVIDVSRDITDQMAVEQALREATLEAESATLAKAEFLANVSHEIRTPMNGVLGALHLLERENISPEGRELMRHAQDSGRMLSQLLNDVLDFSKIEAGQLELAPEPMRPAEALEAVTVLLGAQARAKGVELCCEIEGGDLWIEADPVRVRQAMFNLVGNAVKFTHRGQVTARLVVEPGEDSRRCVSLEVEDTGIGMSAEAQAHLFERFRQAESDTSRRFGGAGLGLSITQALVQLMGGEIRFSSVEGEGSCFCMTFKAPASEAAGLEEVEAALLEGVRILLVEDNATNRLVARTLLARLGASVDEAEDGVAGLTAARAGVHDLILMDIQMPHMDGVAATRAIRGLVGPAARVPILGLTANAMVHQRVEYLAAGMDGVVAKPISPAALLTEIVRVIGQPDEGPATVAA